MSCIYSTVFTTKTLAVVVVLIALLASLAGCAEQTEPEEPPVFFPTTVSDGFITLPDQTVYPEEDTIHIVLPTDRAPVFEFTEEEETMLLQIGMAEAGSVSVRCMACVMRTVLNRVESDGFPNSIRSVIFQKGQFTPTEDGGYYRAIPSDDCREALELVRSGWDDTLGALYFESCEDADNWHSRNLEMVFQVGPMRFYR